MKKVVLPLVGTAVLAVGALAVGARKTWKKWKNRSRYPGGGEARTQSRSRVTSQANRGSARSVRRRASARKKVSPTECLDAVRKALDEAIAEVAEAEFKRLSKQLPRRRRGARLSQAIRSMGRALRSNGTPSYDDWESLYYITRFLPRQINLAYSSLQRTYPNGVRTGLRMVDVGCGPLAAQFAVAALVAEGVAALPGGAVPRVAVAGIDPGGSMRALGSRLWCAFRGRVEESGIDDHVMKAVSGSSETFASFPEFKRSEWILRNLPVAEDATEIDCWLTAFHAVYRDGLEELTRTLDDVWDVYEVRGYEPRGLATTHESKKRLLDGLEEEFGPCDRGPGLRWQGVLGETTAFRKRLAGCCGVTEDAGRELRWPAKWETMHGQDVVMEWW